MPISVFCRCSYQSRAKSGSKIPSYFWISQKAWGLMRRWNWMQWMIDAWMFVMYAVCVIVAPGDIKKNFYMEHPPCLDHVSWKHMDNNNKNDTSKNIYKYMHMFIIYVWFLYMLLFTSFFFSHFSGMISSKIRISGVVSAPKMMNGPCGNLCYTACGLVARLLDAFVRVFQATKTTRVTGWNLW